MTERGRKKWKEEKERRERKIREKKAMKFFTSIS